MSLSNLSIWNGLLIYNSNPVLDPASNVISSSDWSLQLFYQGTTAGESYLFYIGNDTNKYVGIRSLINTGELQLFYPTDLIGGFNTINTGIFATGSFKSYTFVKQGNSFTVYQGNIQPENIGVSAYIYSNPTAFSTAVYPALSNINYMCIAANSPGNSTVSANFINFWNIAVTQGFVKDYYRLTYVGNGPNLLCNIRGETNYATNVTLSSTFSIEKDESNSHIYFEDVCVIN